MVQLNWPTIDWKSSQNALQDAASLEAIFEALDACVKLSSSKYHKLPSSLKKDIVKGILNAFSDNDFPYDISEAEENLLGGLLLKHITAQAAERARDRIPLQQYHDLRRVYQLLFTKLNKEYWLSRPNTMTSRDDLGANMFIESSPELEIARGIRDFVGLQCEIIRPAVPGNEGENSEGAGQVDLFRENGQDASETVSMVDRPKKKGKKRKKRGEDDIYEEAGQVDLFRNKGQDTSETANTVDHPKKKGKIRKKCDGVKQAKREDKHNATEDHGNCSETTGNQCRVQEIDRHKDGVYSEPETDDNASVEDLVRMFRDTEAHCEHICLQLQDFEGRQLEESTALDAAEEMMKDRNMAERHAEEEPDTDADLVKANTLVNDRSDQGHRPNDQAENQTHWDNSQQFQHAREVKHEVARPDASAIITFNIEHQAAVNHLDNMGPDGILRRLSSSLETMRLSEHDDVPHSIRFTNAMLLDNGNVEVHAHAESKHDIDRLSKIRGWDLEFEKSISVPTNTYAVETIPISTDIFCMQTRKQKARVIRELLKENLRFVVSLRGVDDIRNIHWGKEYRLRWCKEYRPESGLVIEFRTTQQADEALGSGIRARGKHYQCQFIDQMVRQCERCQDFGHQEEICLAAHRCGWCASQHATSACSSNTVKCANCYDSHQANAFRCKVRKAHKQRLRYLDASSSVGEREHVELAPEPQSRTAALNLPSSNSVHITPQDEGQIKVEEDEIQNIGPVREHRRARAVVPRQTKVEGSECPQGMGLAQKILRISH